MFRTPTRIAIALAVMFALTAGTGFAVADSKEKPVKKCQKYEYKVLHKPPGNPSNAQWITVGSKNAALAHKKNHGDKYKKVCKKYKKDKKYK